ncbi:DUF6538 domain-containing protein [Cupriavidus sp. amp6]|uniref:DUF6538 domain-containing protein n=1 Tax=Cupriavidus sp. amp6 TaxID=388051 RepID=UPI0004296492|nr:DUF6538 domain-containing protein [Cupriavidus sp. amp6]
MATHLTRRGSMYYLRRRIPLHLVEQYNGKREITRSLGTKTRLEAERLARAISVELDREWQAASDAAARAGEGNGKPKIDPRYYDLAGAFELAELEEQHSAEVDELHADADRLEKLLAIVERRREQASAGSDPKAVPTSAEARKPRSGAKAKSISLESVIELWRRDRQPTDKTVDAVTRAVREAGDPDIHAVNRQAVIAIRDKWIEAGNSVATVNKKIGFIRLLLGIAKSRGMIDSNPAEGAELPPPKRAVELRKPYSPEQAEAVMAATAAMQATDTAMYWLPRLARWTGARLNELHQLRAEDIQERDEHPGLMLTNEGEHVEGVAMALKNDGSRRWVPLAGPVLEFATWAKDRTGPLFPAKANKYGNVSDGFSKRYGRLLRNVVKVADKRVTFHSWRHGFADMCRHAGVSAEVRMALMGHAEGGGAAAAYGAGDGLPPAMLIEAIKNIGGQS